MRLPVRLILLFAFSCNALAGLDDLSFGPAPNASSTASAGGGGQGQGAGGTTPGTDLCVVWTGAEQVRGVYPHGDGFVIASSFSGTLDFGGEPINSAGDRDGLVARFGPNCEIIFALPIGGALEDFVEDVAVLSDGSVIAFGSFNGTTSFGTSQGDWDHFLFRIDPDGNVMWTKTWGGPGIQQPGRISVGSDDHIYVAGGFSDSVTIETTTHSALTGDDIHAFELTPDGALVWSESYGGDMGSARVRGVAVDTGGNLTISGLFAGTIALSGMSLTSNGNNDGFVATLAPGGMAVFATSFGSDNAASNDYIVDLAVRENGNIVMLAPVRNPMSFGANAFTPRGARDMALIELSAVGDVAWARSFGGPNEETAAGLALDDNRILVAGAFDGAGDLGGGAIENGKKRSFFGAVFDENGVFSSALVAGSAGTHCRGVTIAATGDGDVVAGGGCIGVIDFAGDERIGGFAVKWTP
ncbi:MAG TPA: hypothetical protein VFB62_08310 [Polyangiaceae bacterium]|nr:hypothetical protein [Polyangiaceae bacterium]